MPRSKVIYKGPAWKLRGDTFEDAEWIGVEFPEEVEMSLIKLQAPNMQHHVPLPFIVARFRSENFVIEDNDYCKYHDICPTCRRHDCDKMCVPDFARFN